MLRSTRSIILVADPKPNRLNEQQFISMKHKYENLALATVR